MSHKADELRDKYREKKSATWRIKDDYKLERWLEANLQIGDWEDENAGKWDPEDSSHKQEIQGDQGDRFIQ